MEFEQSLKLMQRVINAKDKGHEENLLYTQKIVQSGGIMDVDGGPGSGNWGHVGRPGIRGGSGKGGGRAFRSGSKETGFKRNGSLKDKLKQQQGGGGSAAPKRATTVEEAKTMLTGSIGFVKVNDSFDKLDKETAVAQTNRLAELEEKFGVIHQSDAPSLITEEYGSARAFVTKQLTSPDSQTLSLCGKEYTQSLEQIENSVKRERESGFYMPFSDEYAAVYGVTHEYGHMIQNVLCKQFCKDNGWDESDPTKFINYHTYKPKEALKWYYDTTKKFQSQCKKEIIAIAKKNDRKFKVSDNISRYGKNNGAEFFAEVFANSQCGNPNALGVAMQQWLKDKGVEK